MIDKLVRTAAQAYYEGNPIMSDEIYDHLLELASIEDVGYSANSEKRFPHLYPMFSLQKIWDAEDRPVWKEAFVSPKLDGAAVSILIGEGVVQKVHSLYVDAIDSFVKENDQLNERCTTLREQSWCLEYCPALDSRREGFVIVEKCSANTVTGG